MALKDYPDWVLKHKDYTNSNTVYRNRKLIVTSGNYTSVTQSVGYSYTKIKGHEFNAKIKANKKVYEAEVGYKFTSITEETISATLSVPPWKRISLYKSDVCKKTTRVKNFMTEQVFSKLKWKHYQTWGTFGEYVRYYEGFSFDFVEENL